MQTIAKRIAAHPLNCIYLWIREYSIDFDSIRFEFITNNSRVNRSLSQFYFYGEASDGVNALQCTWNWDYECIQSIN